MCTSLRKHLKGVEKTTGVDFWVDKNIRAGDQWHEKIGDALQRADVILLCISADFVWSDYIETHEMPLIEQRHKAGALVIPVIFRDCYWAHLSVASHQAVPSGAKPIQKWTRADDGYADAARQVLSGIQSITAGAQSHA